MRRKFTLILIFLSQLFFTACKKDKQPLNEDKPIEEPVVKDFYKDLKIDSLQQLSVVVSFQLNQAAKVIGLLTNLDSASLVDRPEAYMEREVAFRNGRYYAKIEWPYNLPPIDDNFWFRLYMVDDKGVKVFSKVFRQQIATYQIKNTYVVNGKGMYNKHPKDFFMNYEGGVIGTYDNSLIINALTKDVNPKNYSATLNEIPIAIGTIEAATYPTTHQQIVCNVPDDFPLGPASLKFYYLNKLVYAVQLTIVNGGLLSSVQHPIANTNTAHVFGYNGKLFTYSSQADDPKLYSWTPETNMWQNLPVPEEMKFLKHAKPAVAKVINGIVYFTPWVHTFGGPYEATPRTYQELIISYNPNTGQGRNTILYQTTNQTEHRNLNVRDFFAYHNKLYCITSESINGQSTESAYRIRVYNPADGSWTHLMDLPYAGVWTAVANENQVFLMHAVEDNQEFASIQFANEFYLLNVEGKSLQRKNWITDRKIGVYEPYLASLNNKIYLYGGYYSTGYTTLYSSLFAVYDPQQDKWSPVSGYSYFTAWVSQNYGFMMPFENKLYLGLGLDRLSNGNIYAGKRNYSIHQVSIK